MRLREQHETRGAAAETECDRGREGESRAEQQPAACGNCESCDESGVTTRAAYAVHAGRRQHPCLSASSSGDTLEHSRTVGIVGEARLWVPISGFLAANALELPSTE